MLPFGLIIGIAFASGLLVLLHNFSSTKEGSDDMLAAYEELLEKARNRKVEEADGDVDEADAEEGEVAEVAEVSEPLDPGEFADLDTDGIKMGGV